MDSDKKLYEASYLLVPLIVEEKVPEEVSALRKAIESEGGLISSEEMPKMRHLAYEVSHSITGGKKKKYEDAYFGWMRYQVSPDKAEKINDSFKKNISVIRYLIVNAEVVEPKPIRDDSKKPLIMKKEKKSTMSEQEIDKEIDELVKEGAPKA